MEWGIKFRPIRPRSPHLNGKVERVQRTDLEEFYSTVSIKQPDLDVDYRNGNITTTGTEFMDRLVNHLSINTLSSVPRPRFGMK